ncbi:unnamed protein product, partial [marine sediment metagenome]
EASLRAHNPPENQEEAVLFLQNTIIEASSKVAPAVVNITTVRIGADFFFNPVPQRGLGSGVIFDQKNGYILTNEHVIHQAKEIKVLLPDGRESEGKLIGSDPIMDLAVVKIKGGLWALREASIERLTITKTATMRIRTPANK